MGTAGNRGGRMLLRRSPRVALDLLDFQPSRGQSSFPDSTRMDLYLAVDYHTLEFLFAQEGPEAVDGYVANYSVTAQVMKQGNLIVDRYEPYIVLESMAEHAALLQTGLDRADAEQLSFLLAPGTGYSMRLTVRDRASQYAFDTSFDFTVKEFDETNPAMSDLMIYRNRNGMHVTPSIGPDVASLARMTRKDGASGSSGLFAELYNMPAGMSGHPRTLGIVSEILRVPKDKSDTAQRVVSRAVTTLAIPPSNSPASTGPPSIPVTPLFAPISFDGLWMGRYTLYTYVLPSARDTSLTDPAVLERHAITSAKRDLEVSVARGIPIAAGDLDQAIEQLRVIATGSEWDSLSSARTSEEKRNAILDFWRKKGRYSNTGSNRAMEVFYSRVEYANAHFGTTFQAGWKSDRGRVYIALGPPDIIDSHPEGYTSAFGGVPRPYEIWEYTSLADRSLDERYVFVDEYIVGDYRLRGALPPEGTFIWE